MVSPLTQALSPLREKVKKRGAHIGAPRHAIETKNKHHHSRALACVGLWPQVFHGGPFGVWGTPSTKPLDCKVWDFALALSFAPIY